MGQQNGAASAAPFRFFLFPLLYSLSNSCTTAHKVAKVYFCSKS
jgi:hypothetical protein